MIMARESRNCYGLITTLVLKTVTEDHLVSDSQKVCGIYKPKIFFRNIKMKQLKFGFEIFLFQKCILKSKIVDRISKN